MKSLAFATVLACALAVHAQTEVWTAVNAKYAVSKRWDLGASFESRWRSSGYQQFSDLRLTRDARTNWKYFYEFRAPLNAQVNPRHTIALEKLWKARYKGTKIADITFGTRYHVNRAARVRYGIYAERSFGNLIPEWSTELWMTSFAPWSDLRRIRHTAALNWEPNKTWKLTLGWSNQTDLRPNGVIHAEFGILRFGIRTKF
jgi:hypothetical protein